MSVTKQSPRVSEFYSACRNGDVDFVKEYLANHKKIPDNLNYLEPNVNSTPLHAASYYGHKEIVELLLEHRFDRSIINGYGLTAFEEAANDEIRNLFKRTQNSSSNRRFQDESIEDCFDVVRRPKEDKDESFPPVPTPSVETKRTSEVQSYKTEAEKQLEIGYSTTSIAMCQSKLGRFIADKFQEDSPMSMNTIRNRLQHIVDTELKANNDPQSYKANELLKKFFTENSNEDIKYLIRLYTLETRFYRSLRKNPMPLALPLYIRLQTLKHRYFQGLSYRGAKMTDDEIEMYKRAVYNRGSLLQTRHFLSTSQQRSVAEEFADLAKGKSGTTRKNRIIFIFNFPQQCDQAIDLSRVSDTEPSLSEFEDESEILVLPWSLFQVDHVHQESSSEYIIHLTNVTLPRKTLFSSFKWILKHPKGSLDRFNQYFSEAEATATEKKLIESAFRPDRAILEKNSK